MVEGIAEGEKSGMSHDEDAQVFPCAPPFPYHSKWGDSPTHVAYLL